MKIKEKLSSEFEGLLRELIHSIRELNDFGDIENLFSIPVWGDAWNVKENAERILKEHGLKIK